MRHISLEVPLRLFALAWRRQRDDAAHPRIETLGDALDDAALAGGVAALEDDDYLELAVDHPVLQLHQFALQAEQFPEIEPPIYDVLGVVFGNKPGEPFVVELHLELFVD